jgi:hypothetical protein
LLSSALRSPHSRCPAHPAVSSAGCCVFLQESEFPPRGQVGPPAPGGFVQFVDQVCSFSYIHYSPRRTCRAAAGGCRRGGAAQRGKEGAGRESFRSAACADTPRHVCVCAQLVHALRNVVARRRAQLSSALALAAPLEERSACGRRGEKRLNERPSCLARHAWRTACVLLTGGAKARRTPRIRGQDSMSEVGRAIQRLSDPQRLRADATGWTSITGAC